MDLWFTIELVTFVSPIVVFLITRAVIGGVISVSLKLISGVFRNDGCGHE